MVHGVGWDRRTLVVLFLCLIVYAQSVPLFAPPEPHHATDHCCLLCHVGSLPFLQVTTSAAVSPVVLVERLIPSPDSEASHDALLSANTSRAPPA